MSDLRKQLEVERVRHRHTLMDILEEGKLPKEYLEHPCITTTILGDVVRERMLSTIENLARPWTSQEAEVVQRRIIELEDRKRPWI